LAHGPAGTRVGARDGHPIAHGPGPPHRPHIPGAGAAELLFPSTAETAKTLNSRAVSFDPHAGHSAFSFALIDRASFSNFASHFLHAYS
jgi:hypothetical protein